MLYLIGYDKRRKNIAYNFYLLMGDNNLKQMKNTKQRLENIRKNNKETFIKYKIINQKEYEELNKKNEKHFKTM